MARVLLPRTAVRFVVALLVMSALTGCAHWAERSAFSRGVEAYRLGQWDAATAAFDDALGFAPSSATLHTNRGAARLAAARYADAIADFTLALRLDPYQAAAAFNRGLARARSGDPAGARRDWRYAAAVEPSAAQREWMQHVVAAQPGATEPTAPLPPATASPPDAAPPAATSPTSVTAPPAQAAPEPAVIAPGEASAPAIPGLAARGVRRALEGDRAGALADLRMAYAREADPERRQRIAYVMAASAGPTPMDYEACVRQAVVQAQAAPSPSASPPGGVASAPPATASTISPPGGQDAAPPFSDRELLEQADPGVRDDAPSRRVFLECMRLRGY